MEEDEIYLDADEIADDSEEEQSPSKTYKIDYEKGRIYGFVDGEEAIQQLVYKTLRSERFEHLIYSDDYGCEIKKVLLSGENDRDIIISELQRTITESLEIDDRIESVDNFKFSFENDECFVSFDVSTASETTNIEVIL